MVDSRSPARILEIMGPETNNSKNIQHDIFTPNSNLFSNVSYRFIAFFELTVAK